MTKINWKTLAVILVLLLPAVRYLILPGFYEPHDLHHFADIYEMYRAFASGQMPPRFGPDFLYSFGYPLFNYYYLLPFYLGAAFHGLGFAITTSYKLVFVASLVLSFGGMYLFLREHIGKAASLFGAMVYLYTPYHAVQTYVRGAMGEVLAYGLAPLVFYFAAMIIKSKKPTKAMGFGSLVFGLFILTHNYYWILILPFLILYIFAFYPLTRKQIGQLITTCVIGVTISLYWIAPALLEKKFITAETPFPLVDHFPFIRQLILPSWGYGSSVWGPGDEISFQIGLVNLAALAGAVWIAIRKLPMKNLRLSKLSAVFIDNLKKDNAFRLLIGSIGLFIVTFVFMNSRTYPIWRVLPFHDLIQFPWRLLAFTALLTSVMAALVFEQFFVKKAIWIKVLVFVLPIVLTWNYFRPSKVVQTDDSYYLNRMFACSGDCSASHQVSQQYLNYSEDYLLLPYWVFTKPDYVPQNVFESESAEITNQNVISPVKYSANISTSKLTRVVANKMYYPGWSIRVGGIPTATRYTAGYGAIEFNVGPGEHEVELVWKETKLRKVFDLISFAGLLVALYFITSKRQVFSK